MKVKEQINTILHDQGIFEIQLIKHHQSNTGYNSWVVAFIGVYEKHNGHNLGYTEEVYGTSSVLVIWKPQGANETIILRKYHR